MLFSRIGRSRVIDSLSLSVSLNSLCSRAVPFKRFASFEAVKGPASFAGGCKLFKQNGNEIMATLCVGEQGPAESLKVEYLEKNYAAGITLKTLGRERQDDNAILKSRIIDRALRPVFPEYIDAQVICTLVSTEQTHSVDSAIVNAATSAILESGIQSFDPVAAVRLGFTEKGEIIREPNHDVRCEGMLLYCGSEYGMVMMEMEGKSVSVKTMQKAVRMGDKIVQEILKDLLKNANNGRGKLKDLSLSGVEEVDKLYKTICASKFKGPALTGLKTKEQRAESVSGFIGSVQEKVGDTYAPELVEIAASKYYKNVFNGMMLGTGVRVDGRQFNNIRPLKAEDRVYDSAHGSAGFSRGDTSCWGAVTMGHIEDSSPVNDLAYFGTQRKNVVLHYDFPPFATGEVGVLKPNRRAIGHGALAEKAVASVIPDDYPFSLVFNCDIMSSDGSSSMASVCAASLAAKSAGLPCELVAGISVGMFGVASGSKKGLKKCSFVEDISGFEDHFGFMDFKIAGSRKGFTACQVDIKTPGIHVDLVVDEIIPTGKSALSKVLTFMETQKIEPVSPACHPSVQNIAMEPEEMASLRSYNGAFLKEIENNSGCKLNINSKENLLSIFARNAICMDRALQGLQKRVFGVAFEDNCKYESKVVNVQPLCATVEIGGQLFLLPRSAFMNENIESLLELELPIGKPLSVKYEGVDEMRKKPILKVADSLPLLGEKDREAAKEEVKLKDVKENIFPEYKNVEKALGVKLKGEC